MTAEFRKNLDEAVDFWKNEESETLLSLLCDYARDVGFYHDTPSMRESNEVNMFAIRKILRERLGTK